MSTYFYDGTFEGLLTVIFSAYKNRNVLNRVIAEPIQLSLNFSSTENDCLDIIYIKTVRKRAERVKMYLCEKISLKFFYDIRICFLSSHKDKDTVIVHTVYKVMERGEGILYSMDDHAFLMNKFIRQVLCERHKYLGLVRFREMHNGILFSVFEPCHNVLPILLPHFRKRLKNEKFAVFDKKRKITAYYDTKNISIFFMENAETEWSSEEEEFSSLWRTFYKSVSIRERENKKLLQKNLPKRYRKHLIENVDEN